MERTTLLSVVLLGLVASGCMTPPDDQPAIEGAKKGPRKASAAPAPRETAPAEPSAGKDSPGATQETFPREEFTVLGKTLVQALSDGTAERFCLSPEDVNALHNHATASIIQVGRLGWLRHVSERIRNASLKFIEVKPGPAFSQTFTPTGPGSPFQLEVPLVTGLAVEVTIDGDPAALVIHKMYLLDSGWKVFAAELTD
jgi:hypothetical protein